MGDFVGIPVPCGYGPPGELPQPLPGGVDGGGVSVPTDPPTGGPIIVYPIDIPGGEDPGVPFPTVPGIILVTETGIDQDEATVNVICNQPVEASATCTGDISQTIFSPGIYQATWSFHFIGLTANTLYNYIIIVKEASQLHLQNIIQGSFTTLQNPAQNPDIINEVALFDTQMVLSVTWDTVLNSLLIATTATLKIFNHLGSIVFNSTSPLGSSHSFLIPGLVFDELYSLELKSTIPGNGTDTVLLPIDSPKSVNISNILTQVTTNSVQVSWDTVTNLNNPSIAQTVINITADGANFQTINDPVFIASHIHEFTSLLANTVYTVNIVNTNNYDSDSRSIQIITMAEPSQNLEELDPVIKDFLLQQTQSDIYAEFTSRSANEKSEIDLKYTPYTIKPTGFKPVYSQTKVGILEPIRHKSIDNIIKSETTTLEVASLDKENITDSDIKVSLNKKLGDIVYNIRHKNGVPILESMISDSIKNHIIDNTLDNIDTDYLLNLKHLVVLKNPSEIDKNPIKKVEYGTNVKDLKSSRIVKPPTKSIKQVERSKTFGLEYLKNNLLSLDPSKYSDASKELLKLWYCIPSDINKRVQILLKTGETEEYFVEDDESVQYLDLGGSAVTGFVSINDTIDYLDEHNNELDYYVLTDINRAYTIKNSDELLVKYHLGVTDDILLEVTGLNTNIELDASNTASIDNHYVLVLDASNISYTYNDQSPFIIETRAKYNLKSKTQAEIDSINDDIKYRAYPWRTFAIDHNDPILDYFAVSDASSNSFSFTFKDLTYKKVGSNEDSIGNILVRKIPKFILILPTNKTRYNFYNGHSILNDWNVRQLRFEKSPDIEFNDVGLVTHPFNVENTFVYSQGESKTGFFSTQAFHCRYSSEQPQYNLSYKDPDNKPTRLEDGFRKMIKIVNSLTENYNLSGGLTYYDVLSRLERREIYTLPRTVSKAVINKLETGDKFGTLLFNIKGPTGKNITARRSSTRLVNLKSDGVDEYKVKYADFDVQNSISQVIQEKQVTSEFSGGESPGR